MGWFTTPEDVARVAEFLADLEQSHYIGDHALSIEVLTKLYCGARITPPPATW